MRIRYMIPAVFCLTAAAALGLATQGAKGLAGKWGTDAAVAKAANPAAATTGQAVMLDIKVDASNKVTGSIKEYGNALCGAPDTNLKIDSGTVDGKVVTFVTTRPNPCPAADAAPGTPVTGTQVTWTGTLGDDDSLSVTRAIGGRGGAGGGGGGRGGPGAGGAPPAGGTPPAGAPPAGGGGGRGGRGGGGAMVMHRIP